MNKNQFSLSGNKCYYLIKFIMIMKISAFLLLFKLLTVSAINASPDQVITQNLAGSNFNYKIFENDLLVITSGDIFLQQKITGKVTEESGAPLHGVSVFRVTRMHLQAC